MPPADQGYTSYDVKGVKLWIPDFMEFQNDEVKIELRGFLWASNLVVESALIGHSRSSSCGSCHCH
ncbi:MULTISPECIES: hypothetical protein [Aminobacterium]|uniref:hypothetical protein n=1 Tax=Aminobacterium TaxID=81466 RepID=UPI00257FE9DB|nr:hypothetical protein [Aminobacterium sp. UBA4834]